MIRNNVQLGVLFLSLILLPLTAAAARNPQFLTLGTEAGLSHAGVTVITQDRHGFIWIGTQEGLNRFNGYDFESFEKSLSNDGNLRDDWIWSLLEDDKGRFYVGTNNGGLALYQEKTGTFANYLHDPQDPTSIPGDRVRTLMQDNRGEIWAGTNEGLARFDPDTGQFETFSTEQGLPSNSVNVIYELDDQLMVGTDLGLAMFDRDAGEFAVHSVVNGVNVRSLVEYQGDLWIGTHNSGVAVLDLHGSDIEYWSSDDEPGSLSGNLVRDLLVDEKGTLWLATDTGLGEWLPAEQRFRTYLPDASDIHSLPGAVIADLFLDASNVLWVGTYSGISRWNYASDAFASVTKSNGALDHDVVTAITEGINNELWVGSYGGGIDRLALSPLGNYVRKELEDLALADQRVMALAYDSNKQHLWIGTRTAGLYCYQIDDRTLIHFVSVESDLSSLSSNGITSLLADDDSLWVGTYGGGLNRMRFSEPGVFSRFRFDAEDPNSLASDRVLTIFKDSESHYWVGTEDGGLNRLNALQGNFFRYNNQPNQPSTLSNNAAWEIFESVDKRLWVGTLGGGLNYTKPDGLDLKSGFSQLTKRDGLPSNTIFGILDDSSGNLWFSSNEGLTQYLPGTRLFRKFDRHNGLRGNEFNFGARLKTTAGRLVFGGASGLVTFDPEDVRRNMNPPPVVVEAASSEVDGVSSYLSDVNDRRLTMRYPDRTVRFSFSALDYSSPDKNRYRYRLEGFDDDWLDAGQYRQANYTNLPSGDYVFRVIASNNDLIWNEVGASVSLTVVPPPWLSWWAYTLYALLILGGVATYVVIQRNKLAQAAEMQMILETQVRDRTHELNERNQQLESANELLRKASMTDALTGLNNRRYLYEYLETQVANLHRQFSRLETQADGADIIRKEASLFFLMIDLDGFKKINDTFGHAGGDRALVQVRDVLRASTRESDIIIRWGGDEFLIVGQSEGLEGVKLLAERIRSSIAEHTYMVGDGNVGYVAGSIGFAHYPFNAANPRMLTWERAVALADQAAYVSKRNGGNAWTSFVATDQAGETDVILLRDMPSKVLSFGKIDLITSIEGSLSVDGMNNRDD